MALGRILALALAAALAGPGDATARDGTLEYPVKAAFLAKFGPFVDWPAGSFAGPESPLTLCVAGEDPFGATLDQVARDLTAQGRRQDVRRVAAVKAAVQGCHILYLGRGADGLLDAVSGGPVLTVTDAAMAPATRGILHFEVREDRVRFHVDDAAAARAGLGISSKLLGLALSVVPRG